MTCTNCGGTEVEEQGFMVIDKNKDQPWAQKFLENKMCTCMNCGFTLGYREKGERK